MSELFSQRLCRYSVVRVKTGYCIVTDEGDLVGEVFRTAEEAEAELDKWLGEQLKDEQDNA